MDDLILYDIDPDSMTEEEKERLYDECLFDVTYFDMLLEERKEV